MKRKRGIRIVLSLAAGLALLTGPAAAQERFRQRLPAPDPRPEFRLPRLESSTLSNGLSMTVVYRENQPITSLHMVFFCGERASPDKTPGLATLAAGIFGQGTQVRPASEIEERIESLGASFAVAADRDVIVLGFHFPEEFLDQALDLVAEMILQPRIGDREIKIVQSMVSAEISASERDPSFLAHRFLGGLLFQGHPYGKFAFGRGDIKAWTSRDLVAFLESVYPSEQRPNHPDGQRQHQHGLAQDLPRPQHVGRPGGRSRAAAAAPGPAARPDLLP
jgi:Predicted Zn-dependent peptidases